MGQGYPRGMAARAWIRDPDGHAHQASGLRREPDSVTVMSAPTTPVASDPKRRLTAWPLYAAAVALTAAAFIASPKGPNAAAELSQLFSTSAQIGATMLVAIALF